jgi:hypothetical protein
MNSAWATAEPSHEIGIDESHRVLVTPVFGCGAFYVALIIGLLAAICGFTWIILNASALPFGFPSARTSIGNRLSSNVDSSFYATSGRMPETQKWDRLQIYDAIVHETDQDTPVMGPQGPKLSSSSPASGRCATVECLLVGGYGEELPTHTTLTGAKAAKLRTPTKTHSPTGHEAHNH